MAVEAEEPVLLATDPFRHRACLYPRRTVSRQSVALAEWEAGRLPAGLVSQALLLCPVAAHFAMSRAASPPPMVTFVRVSRPPAPRIRSAFRWSDR